MTASTGEQLTIAHDHCRHRHGSTDVSHARKKARAMKTESQREELNNKRLRLRVDVHSPGVATPHAERVCVRHHAPFIVGDIRGYSMDDSGSLDEDEPFVIARKLLRRRHVRKEQLRKDRETLKLRETWSRRTRKANELDEDNTRVPGFILNATTNSRSLPQLSPMLSKSDSFSDLDKAKDQTDGKDTDWPLESNEARGQGFVGLGDAFQIAHATTSFANLTSPITFPFSPLRSRASRTMPKMEEL